MEEFRNFHYYLQRVRKEHIVMENTWTYNLSKFMKVIRIWYDAEDYPKTTFVERTITMIIRILLPIMWISLFVEYCREYKNIPISKMCEGFSLIVGFLLTYYHVNQYAWRREDLTKMIAFVNNKFQEMQKVDTPHRREELAAIRDMYVIQGYVGLIGMSMGTIVGSSQGIFSLITGRLYYDSSLPFDQTPYCLQWFLQSLYQVLVVIFLGVYYSLKELVLLGMFFEITMLGQVQSADIRNLCSSPDYDPQVELNQLKVAIKETSDLLDIGNQLRDFVSDYLFTMFASFNIILPMAGFAILIESEEDGWINAIAKSFFYPTYCALIMISWSFIGEKFTESFEGIRDAIYDSNWPFFPQNMRKMLIFCQLRLQKSNFLEGGFLFVMRLLTVTEVFQRTYVVLTLLGDMVKK